MLVSCSLFGDFCQESLFILLSWTGAVRTQLGACYPTYVLLLSVVE